MPSIVGKKQDGKTYYYAVESARVEGKPRIVSQQRYLGSSEEIMAKIAGAGTRRCPGAQSIWKPSAPRSRRRSSPNTQWIPCFGRQLSHALIAGLIGSGVLLDERMVYFDARLSRNHPRASPRMSTRRRVSLDDAPRRQPTTRSANTQIRPLDFLAIGLLIRLLRGLSDSAVELLREHNGIAAQTAENLAFGVWGLNRSDIICRGAKGKPHQQNYAGGASAF